jgi:hypothetical protein
MKYLLVITRNKLIGTHSIICEPLSLFAAVSLTLQLNEIALHMVLILESMGSGSREIDGDKAIGATFSMKLLPPSCGDLCLSGCKVLYSWMTQTMRSMI